MLVSGPEPNAFWYFYVGDPEMKPDKVAHFRGIPRCCKRDHRVYLEPSVQHRALSTNVTMLNIVHLVLDAAMRGVMI